METSNPNNAMQKDKGDVEVHFERWLSRFTLTHEPVAV